ncbi:MULTISPECIES: zinc-binding dehydrogenase [unclassified Curtobacterium]|uniref:zinc-binding dehydrogenase n=1 Tax=unclassified Curtobacterium TaxID=257496 RepID=UPI003A80F56F
MTDATHTRMMTAVVTTGIGGVERLEHRRVPVPAVGPGDVLVRVAAAGVNNTDINTRIGWYSSSVRDGTGSAAPLADGGSGGYAGPSPFPLIQGADCCGTVVEAGSAGSEQLLGQRVLVRSCMTGLTDGVVRWLGSDRDGAFAEYVAVPVSEVFPVTSGWSDAELATIPCSSGTAENMLERSGVGAGTRVLVTGASGGVGSAAVQLALRRGARVIAVASPAKHDRLRALGVTEVIDRNVDLAEAMDGERVDVAVDNVAGPGFGDVLGRLVPGGTYVTSGAIAGPVVELDLRRLYLDDLRLIGTTTWDDGVFPQVVSAVEHDEIRPLLAATFPLDDIVAAQEAFQDPGRFGNIALVPRRLPSRGRTGDRR